MGSSNCGRHWTESPCAVSEEAGSASSSFCVISTCNSLVCLLLPSGNVFGDTSLFLHLQCFYISKEPFGKTKGPQHSTLQATKLAELLVAWGSPKGTEKLKDSRANATLRQVA